jgi:hypothetical protein
MGNLRDLWDGFSCQTNTLQLKGVCMCVCVCLRERERERERERTSKLALSHDFLQLGNKVLITALSLTEI